MAVGRTIGVVVIAALLACIGRGALDAYIDAHTSEADKAKAAKAASDATKAQSAQDTQKKIDDAHFQQAVAVARALRDGMKNPESFKIDKATRMKDGSLCVTYRGTNSFNATVPSDAVYASGKFAVASEPGFEAVWNRHCGGKTGDSLGDAISLALKF